MNLINLNEFVNLDDPGGTQSFCRPRGYSSLKSKKYGAREKQDFGLFRWNHETLLYFWVSNSG